MNHWYVVQTKPKKEKEVEGRLASASFDVFFPQIKAMRQTLVSFKPLFPSYLFVRSDFKDQHIHRIVRFTRGVNRILGGTEGPHPIHDTVVDTIKDRTSNGSLIEQNLLFKEGDDVTVKKGILKDLQGIIKKNLSAEGRVKVLFRWFNSSMRAVLRYTELEKAT